jgi:Spy/CpxP family protein refolding chaperone
MKRMISIAAVFLLFVFAAEAAGQQQGNRPQLSDRAKRMVERRLKRLDEALQLTDEQKAKIRSILENQAAQMNFDRTRIRQLSREERMQLMQQMRRQWQQTNRKIEEILTPDQVKKFRELQKNSRRGRRRPRRSRR